MRYGMAGPSAVVLLLTLPGRLAAQEARPAGAALTPWVEAFESSRTDLARALAVQDLTLVRDAATLRFVRGRVYPLRPLEGRTLGVVFVGEGTLSVSAPIAVEAAEVERAFGAEEVSVPFGRAVLLFTDATLVELAGSPGTGRPEGEDPDRELEEALRYLVDDGVVDAGVMAPLLDGAPGFFYAHVADDRDDPVFFTLDPYREEEVTLSRRTRRGRGRRVVASFHRQSDYATGTSVPAAALDAVTVDHYDIDVRLEKNLDLHGSSTARITRVAEGRRWVPFTLAADLEVDSVSWSDGSAALFHRPRDSAQLWVDVGGWGGGGDALTIHYHGDVLDRPRDLWVTFDTYRAWFPAHAYGRPATYRLRYDVPDDFVVSSVGAKREEYRADGRVVSTWETGPVHQVTFNVGAFDEYVSEGPPSLRVHVNERAHRTLTALAAERNLFLLEQRNMAEAVARDLRRSLAFFGEVYGATPVTDFLATEIPESHGEAFPGLVLLSWTTFQWTGEAGYDEMFRAHEVAHQWWGIGVRPATYRDHWLAEGLAEFSGLWYTARVRGSVDLYYKRLREMRDGLLERRGEVGPIWLGYRTATERHPEDYQTVVYQKGAWVMHMLRSLLTDHDSGSDAVFVQAVRSFYERHRGGAATTADLQRAFEEAAGADLGWFFDEWVYGTRIPTYRFSYRYETQPDGSVKATVRVRQEDVDEAFGMIVPILLDFGAEGSAVVRLNVQGPVTEAALPLLPREPDAIVFNAYEAVLAEVKTEDWEDDGR